MEKYIEKFQFITHDIPHRSHIEQATLACEAGAKWIQYRCLSKTDEELLKDINAIAAICDDWGSTLIVTDHVHLAGKADIQGFHIEAMDADFIALRKKLGNDLTLGGSVNTLNNLLRMAKTGADYFGFGPFAETKTKPNDYPFISLAAYKEAVEKFKELNLDLPIFAVGGVELKDVPALMKTGIYGVAVSHALNFTNDFADEYEGFYNAVKA
ncbi:thiamine-phosphate pyrophosphorylase [Pedobacter sp. UYP30]|uniref:thiamine phosphate synthase n=1 Tax=Pedobacter sp. UYP30 TaxID=1756400 RepID=UPI00339233F5